MLLMAEGFAHAAPDSIADHGFAKSTGSGETETRLFVRTLFDGTLFRRSGKIECRKARTRHARSLIVHFAKVTWFQDARALWESQGARAIG